MRVDLKPKFKSVTTIIYSFFSNSLQMLQYVTVLTEE